MRFSTRQLLIATGFLCVVLGAFAHGNRLLGTGVGVVFGAIATLSLYVVWRVFTTKRRFQLARQVAAVLFALALLTALAIPAKLNPNLAYSIECYQTERTTGSQLQDVLAGDPRFSDLTYRCSFRKCIVVRVRGRIGSESDLLELRERIFSNCPNVSSRWLHWRVIIEDSGVMYDDCDLTVFGDPESGS